MRAASTASMLSGRRHDRPPARTATSCSRNSGLPSAISRIRPVVRGRSPSGASAVDERARSASESASSWSSERPGCASAHAGRLSSSSGRARQTSRIGDSGRERGEVLDEVEQGRLGPVGVVDHDHERPSPRRRASNSRRTAQNVSIACADSSARPIAPSTRRVIEAALVHVRQQVGDPLLRIAARELVDDLRQRSVRDPVAVGEAPADDDSGLDVRRPRRTRAGGATCRSREGRPR